MLKQEEYQYDANGNVLLTTIRERHHDEIFPGSLNNPAYPRDARVSYFASYYDALDRVTDVVNLGTNGGASYTWSSIIPARSNTELVTSYGYDDAGWLQTITDPRGIVGKTYYDALGRKTKTIEAYTNGTPTDTTNKTVEYTYDGNGNIFLLKVVLPGGGQQTTEYVYGVDTMGGSALFSNDLVAEVHHPDKSTGAASGTEDEVYTYNALGQVKTATDRNGTTHTYTYDVLGRQISDAITTPGSGIDQSVLRIETAYDIGGRPVVLTSYDAAIGGNVANQVLRTYNSFGQITAEYQSHDGVVNISTTPKVQYTYNTPFVFNSNYSRLVSMTYPDGRVLHYGYSVGLDNDISRISYLADDNGSGGIGTHLEEYQYLGLDTVVSRSRPEPGVNLTYIKQTGGSNGDAGDQYTGLDRFGRIIDQRWLDPATGTATDRFQYGYDRNGNRLYRENLLDSAMDELYHASGSGNGYDSLNQLTGFVRGALSASSPGGTLDTVSSPSRSQGWDFDALGNWESVSTNGTPETRDHNAQNQVTGVGASTLTYDANGNMTTDETGRKFVYNGWNRLMEVKDSSNNPLVDYTYDALGRRISGDNGTEVHLYYSAQWQMLEERINGIAVAQNVWSPLYVDALVLRDRDADGLGGTLEERLYVQQDANWNVTAITDETGAVVERYIYDPYGQVSVLAANWTARSSSAYGWVYLHQGGRYDEVSKLFSFRHRDYSPTLGRWTSRDPIGFSGFDANLYRYIGNNPKSSSDPTGLQGIRTGFMPQPWPVIGSPRNTIVFLGPPHLNDNNDSFRYKAEFCKSIGIPEENVFAYNGTKELIEAYEKAWKLHKHNPSVVFWGHAAPGVMLIGEKPNSPKEGYDAGFGANTIGSILKNLGAIRFYNLGCNTYSKIGGKGAANGKRFFDEIQKTSGPMPMYGTIGLDMPGKTLSDELDDKPPKWYMQPGGSVFQYGSEYSDGMSGLSDLWPFPTP